MFSLDARIRGIPANRDQVLSFYQSINQPHLAIPGKKAGATQAYIVGLRSQAGLNALVYLYISDANDCAVYTCDRRNVGPDQLPALEQEAIGFLESMGFMMDNMNFTALSQPEQEELMRTLPVFMRDPAAAAKLATASQSGSVVSPGKESGGNVAVELGRIFSAF
jgi:hypothetical protein